MTHAQNWLKAAADLVIIFGVIVALGAHPATDGVPLFFLELIVGSPGVAEMETTVAMRLLSAIAGGVMVGWGVTLYYVAGPVLEMDPGLARRIIGAGVISWFLVDSTGSVIAGAPLNVLGNLVFLAAFLLPLRAMARTVPQGA